MPQAARAEAEQVMFEAVERALQRTGIPSNNRLAMLPHIRTLHFFSALSRDLHDVDRHMFVYMQA